MDFSQLPDTAFLRIFDYLPWEECIRIGVVSKSFRRISLLVASRTKSLDLTDEDLFWNLAPNQLRILLDLCSQNLERIKFPTYGGAQYASILANYECPRLVDLNLDFVSIENDVFGRLIRNNRSLESVLCRLDVCYRHTPPEDTKYIEYPDVITENLKILTLSGCNDDTLRSVTNRCPNLERLDILMKNVSTDVFDQFITSIPQVQEMTVHFIENQIAVEDLISFWDRPLTSLEMSYSNSTLNGTVFANDEVLRKVSKCFPRLKTLSLWCIEATNGGVWSLGNLSDLERLTLTLPGDDFDNAICGLANCGRLQELIVYNIFCSFPLIYLLRCCSQLRVLFVCGILDVKSGEEAALVLKSLSGMPKRDVTIGFRGMDAREEAYTKSIWQADSVTQMIKELKDTEGFEIKFEWVEGQFMVEEAENVEEI